MSFSQEVLALKETIGELHPNLDLKIQRNKKIVIRIAFEPKGITSEQLAAKLGYLNKHISCKTIGQQVTIAFESECSYGFDVFEA